MGNMLVNANEAFGACGVCAFFNDLLLPERALLSVTREKRASRMVFKHNFHDLNKRVAISTWLTIIVFLDANRTHGNIGIREISRG